jgi:hypothetical protein
MSRHDGYLYRTFEYVEPCGDMAHIELRILFSFTAGTAGVCFGPPDVCHPPEPAEWEFIHAEREFAGKWRTLFDGEWLSDWCFAALDAADEDDIVAATGEAA